MKRKKLNKSIIFLIGISVALIYAENVNRVKWRLTSTNVQKGMILQMHSSPSNDAKFDSMIVDKNPFGGSEFKILDLQNISGILKGEEVWYHVDYHTEDIRPFWTRNIQPFESLKRKTFDTYKSKMKGYKISTEFMDKLNGYWLAGDEFGEWLKPKDTGLGYSILDMPSSAERIFLRAEQECIFIWSYQTDGISDYLVTDFKVLKDSSVKMILNGKYVSVLRLGSERTMDLRVRGVQRGNFSRNYIKVSDSNGYIPPEIYGENINFAKIYARKLKR